MFRVPANIGNFENRRLRWALYLLLFFLLAFSFILIFV